MQALTAPPREGLTEAQVLRLITGPRVVVGAGLDLLNDQGRFVEDISHTLVQAGSSVEHAGRELVHGMAKLTLIEPRAWGRDRVRPWVTLSDGVSSARFNLGVFVLTTTPQTMLGESLPTFQATGYDLLQLLQDDPGDTYVVSAGTPVIEAVRAVLVAAGAVAPVLLDGTAVEAVVPSTMVWAVAEGGGGSWLTIINDLLASIGYIGLWVDHDGNYRSRPYQAPATAATVYEFAVTDPAVTLVGRSRALDEDVWGKPNWWRFVRKGMATKPVEGAGVYTVENLTSGPASQLAVGRVVRKPLVFLDAVDQAALVAQGDRIVQEDMTRVRTISIEVDPLPIVGHLDVVNYADTGLVTRCVVVQSEVRLDGAPGRWVLEVVA